MKKLLLLSASCLFIATSFAQTIVPALIQSNQTWTKSGSPYLIGQSTLIEQNVKVTVDSGVEVYGINGNPVTLTIDGELRGLGTKNDRILFRNLSMVFTTKAVSYNPPSGKGTYFNFCQFDSSNSFNLPLITLNTYNAKFDNCIFRDAYYMIQLKSSSNNIVNLEMSNCEMLNSLSNGTFGDGYPIRYSGSYGNFNLKISNTSFSAMRGLDLNGIIDFAGNNIKNFQVVAAKPFQFSNIKCNTFKHVQRGLDIVTYDSDTTAFLNFEGNSLDSFDAGNFGTYYMLKVSKLFNMNYSFNNNNFLTHSKGKKVLIAGFNSNMSTFIAENFRDNYWGSSNVNDIDSFIRDYNDDIAIYAKASYTGYLNSKAAPICKKSSCNPNFFIAIDSGESFNIYLVHNSTGTTNNTKYTWDFGDGTKSNLKSPSHFYDSFALYNICLTLEDSSNGCFGTYCRKVGLDSFGTLLMTTGFSVNVVTLNQFLSIDKKGDILPVNIFPNPSTGEVHVFIPEMNNGPSTIVVLNSVGKELLKKESHVNRNTLNLNNSPNGIYIIQVSNGAKSTTQKIILSK